MIDRNVPPCHIGISDIQHYLKNMNSLKWNSVRGIIQTNDKLDFLKCLSNFFWKYQFLRRRKKKIKEAGFLLYFFNFIKSKKGLAEYTISTNREKQTPHFFARIIRAPPFIACNFWFRAFKILFAKFILIYDIYDIENTLTMHIFLYANGCTKQFNTTRLGTGRRPNQYREPCVAKQFGSRCAAKM